MSATTPEEVEKATEAHSNFAECARYKDAMAFRPLQFCPGCAEIAKTLHSHAEEAVKARDEHWRNTVRDELQVRDSEWTDALFGGPEPAEEPEAAARRLQAAMENRRDARDQWWKAHEAAAVHDRDREWHTELGIAESIDYKPHGAARFLIERHEAECEWRTRFERLNVLVAEEEEAVKAATEEADEHWVRESDHWHKLYEQERQAREKAEALAESRRLIIASQHAEREQIIANAHRNVAEEREAREKAEKELAREKNVSAEWERTFRGCEQAMLRAEKELAEARATKDMYKERWQTALADLSRVRDLHDQLSDEVARLKADKKRCHALLQDAFNHIDPVEFSFLQNNILKELDEKCEPGECTDSCEKTTKKLRARLKKAKKALGHVAHDAAEWSTIATQRHDENAALRKRVEELENNLRASESRHAGDSEMWEAKEAELLDRLNQLENCALKELEAASFKRGAEWMKRGAEVFGLVEKARREGAEDMRERSALEVEKDADLARRQDERASFYRLENAAIAIRALPIDPPKAPSHYRVKDGVPVGRDGKPCGCSLDDHSTDQSTEPDYGFDDPPKAQAPLTVPSPIDGMFDLTPVAMAILGTVEPMSGDPSKAQEEKPKEPGPLGHPYDLPGGSTVWLGCRHNMIGENGYIPCGKLKADHQ